MDHHGTMCLVVRADKFESKSITAGEIVIQLNRSQLPLSTDAVVDHEISLGSIEGSFPGLLAEFHSQVIADFDE